MLFFLHLMSLHEIDLKGAVMRHAIGFEYDEGNAFGDAVVE